MDEGMEDVASSESATSAVATITAKRSAVKAPDAKQRRRRRERARPGRGRRLRAQGLVTLVGLLLVAGVAASLVESGWQSFNPVNGIGVFGQLPFQPQSFGDTSTLPPAPTGSASQPVTAINGQTHKPTAKPTATVGSVGSSTGPLSPTYTGSWSGGTGQGCPSGGAPTPRPYVIYNASSYGAPRSNMVALTFDDGPTPNTTPPILDFLEQSHTPATFFVMGQYARAYPWLIQREAADGFSIGVHTWDHPDMRLLSPSARANELGSTIQQLHADLGPSFCAWLWRPPYGAVNSGIVQQAGGFGLTTINWDVDPQDWARPGTMVIVQRVLAQVRPGSIILMHDGPAARQETAAALPYILAGLRQRGLVPVTVPTLLGSQSASTGPAPAPTATATPTTVVTPTATATTAPSPTATDTPTPAPTATNTPTTATGVWLAGGSGDAIPSALGLWLWQNIVPGYSGA